MGLYELIRRRPGSPAFSARRPAGIRHPRYARHARKCNPGRWMR